ncbi:MAG: GTP cyclohydrolase II [Alkalinema sp. CAN_BIN05]|nr:GTP cyclohydrolase II [Alkalinema sp. CAN_BIN05]
MVSQSHSRIIRSRSPHNHPSISTSIRWGERSALDRGPVVGTLVNHNHRNVIGTHGGSYGIYRALSVASGELDPGHQPLLEHTEPLITIAPNEAWFDPTKIVSLDPWGAIVIEMFAPLIQKGYQIRPTIAITQAHLNLPEIQNAISKGTLTIDGEILKSNGSIKVTKIAIDPVWYLPGIAKRLGIDEQSLRQALHDQTGGMFPEFLNNRELKVWLPPIGNTTVYIFGNADQIQNESRELTLRVHDECNGSDVFGSDICTCRPYLIQGIEESIKIAQSGGTGIVAYFRKEGRALGEVTKFLVYNARKRQGDRADQYFERTECVAGVQDARMQILMPDVLHWLGVKRIDRLVSMSDHKYNAIVNSGIQVIDRIMLADDLIPLDARVEIEAKKAAGYYSA